MRTSESVAWAGLVLVPAVLTFNLEPRIAIVKRGPPGRYFGYSVAQHQILDRSSLDSLALAGAPRDNSSQPGTPRSLGMISNVKRIICKPSTVAISCCRVRVVFKYCLIRLQFNFHLWR